MVCQYLTLLLVLSISSTTQLTLHITLHNMQKTINYSNPLVGGARRDRTADLLHAMQALSQLSYSPGSNRHPTELLASCQPAFQLAKHDNRIVDSVIAIVAMSFNSLIDSTQSPGVLRKIFSLAEKALGLTLNT